MLIKENFPCWINAPCCFQFLKSNKFIYFNNLDPRTADWPLVKSPLNPVLVVLCYLYFSVNVKTFTQKLPVYQLKGFIIGYNAVLVALSSYMAFEVI